MKYDFAGGCARTFEAQRYYYLLYFWVADVREAREPEEVWWIVAEFFSFLSKLLSKNG